MTAMISILKKLGIKPLIEMSPAELTSLVSADRQRRSIERALGRVKRQMKGLTKPKLTLDNCGLAPSLVAAMRATYKNDDVALTALRQKGLI